MFLFAWPLVVLSLAPGASAAPATQPTASATPRTAPATPPPTPPSSTNDPTPSSGQAAPPSDIDKETVPYNPYTGRPLQFDPQTGTLVVPRDPTTGLPLDLVDSTGQPIILRDSSGQEIEAQEPQIMRADSLLRAEGRGRAFNPLEQVGRGTSEGGRRYHLRLGLVEGYSTNALETQASNTASAPIVQHGALFTGLEGSADMVTWTGDHDPQTFRVAGRFQHYVTLDGSENIDDGTVNGSWSGAFTLGKRTVLSSNYIGTLTSANSALVSDGPLFQFDPSNFTHVYTLENLRLALTHELSPKWRVTFATDAWLGTTVSEAPIQLPPAAGSTKPQLLYHSGLDYVTPEAEFQVSHDLSPADIGTVIFRYTAAFAALVLDYSKTPATYNGTSWNHAGTMLTTWTHGFNDKLRSVLTAGASLAEAPPLDVNQSPVIAPSLGAMLVYQRSYWVAALSGSYSYGSANPRLGFGPSQGGGIVLQGLPNPHGDWRKLAVLASGNASNSTFAQGGGQSVQLISAAATLEARYALNYWLGLTGGYSLTYIDFKGAGSFAPFDRSVFFLGLSGFFSNDGTIPTIESFALSITPPS